jgi:hypothetical protein
LKEWATRVGPFTGELVEFLLQHLPHPEQGYRCCHGLRALAKRYGELRLEAACRRALLCGLRTRRSVADILKQGADGLPLPEAEHEAPALARPPHANLRGAHYYH